MRNLLKCAGIAIVCIMLINNLPVAWASGIPECNDTAVSCANQHFASCYESDQNCILDPESQYYSCLCKLNPYSGTSCYCQLGYLH